MLQNSENTIESLGNNTDKLEVQKSAPLFDLWKSDLTLSEFKILDTYLARINSNDASRRVVTFRKGELEQLLGVQKIKPDELKDRLMHLLREIVKIPDEDEEDGFRLITLFEEAKAQKDDYGLWEIKLECTQKAMKYFFNIQNMGYFRYKLRSVVSFVSRYTYIMFTYLEKNRFRKIWSEELGKLKEILGCSTEETYKAYKRFNDLILKKVHKEINEKTECKYTYEPIKKGRTVIAIQFELEALSKDIIDEDQIMQMAHDDLSNFLKSSEEELWVETIKDFNFNDEQIGELKAALDTVPYEKMPNSPAAINEPELMRYHYMDGKTKALIRIDREKTIRNKFAYLLKSIKEDAV